MRLLRPPTHRSPSAAALLMLLASWGGVAAATDDPGPPPHRKAEEEAPQGRPRLLVVGVTVPPQWQQELPETKLRKEALHIARTLDWGAGRGARVEFRISVDELEVVRDGDHLRVRCRASGELPHRRRARSELEFGFALAQRQHGIELVSEMVLRGVLTRLAELERGRRERAD